MRRSRLQILRMLWHNLFCVRAVENWQWYKQNLPTQLDSTHSISIDKIVVLMHTHRPSLSDKYLSTYSGSTAANVVVSSSNTPDVMASLVLCTRSRKWQWHKQNLPTQLDSTHSISTDKIVVFIHTGQAYQININQLTRAWLLLTQ